MKKNIALFLFLISVSFSLFAQTSLEVSAEKEMEVKNYSKAISLYEKILQKGKSSASSAEIYKKLGDCYSAINRYNSAVSYYDRYLELEDSPDENFLIKYYGQVLECGDVSQALKGFKDLKKKNSASREISHMFKCCEFATAQLAKTNLPPIKNQEQLNSPESEFGLAFYNHDLIFSSQQLASRHVSLAGRTDEGYSDIYFAKFDSDLGAYDSAEKMPGKINAAYNEGTFTFHKPTQTAYVSQCKKKPEICRIMTSKLEGNKWRELKEVKLGNQSYDFAHPVLTPDGKTMYFSSNMPGGFGGRDIWKTTVSKSGVLGKPVNLGNDINSEKDEMFPSVIGDSVLFFASEGHVGMGGLDIFYSKISDGRYEEPVNPGAPINSSGDDFSIIFNPDLDGGYFCSKRGNEENSDDIYRFYHNIFLEDIDGVVIDSILTSPLDEVKATCKYGDEIMGIFYTDSVGAFYIPSTTFLDCKQKHTLTFFKNGYIVKTVEVPCEGAHDMLIPLYNNIGIHCIEGYVVDITNNQPVEGAEVKLTTMRNRQDVVYTDKNGYYTFKDVPANDYVRLHITRPGYLSDSRNFTSPGSTEKVCMNVGSGYPADFKLYPLKEQLEFKIENIYYELDKARLLPESKESLDKLVKLLDENPGVKIKINSHTDERGSDEYNYALSDRRSQSVVSYLLNAGVSANRLKSEGFGERKLVVKHARTEAEHALNRRTTFELFDVAGYNRTSVDNYEIVSDNSSFERYNNSTVGNSSRYSSSVGRSNNAPYASNVSGTASRAGKSAKSSNGGVVYRIQLLAIGQKVNKSSYFRQITDNVGDYEIYEFRENNLNKYQLGDFYNRTEAQNVKNKCKRFGFNDCFIVTVHK